jgi:hypothetical protein
VIPFEQLSPLCGLIADGIGVPDQIVIEVLDSLSHWWRISVDADGIKELTDDIKSLAQSSVSPSLAERLLNLLGDGDSALRQRTGAALAGFGPLTATGEVGALLEELRNSAGVDRWKAAAALADRGLDDQLILSQFQERGPTRLHLKPRTPISAIRNFDRARFQALYKNCTETTSAYDKGIALEDLAEYLFLCLPGLGLVARRLRTLAEEVDLAFSNEGDGFLRELGDPFLVECKNTLDPVDASTMRNLRVKVQTKGLRSAFLVTTAALTKDALVAVRDAKRDHVILAALEGTDLNGILTTQEPMSIVRQRVYASRLL